MELQKVKKEDLLECPYCKGLLAIKKTPTANAEEASEKPKRKYTKRKAKAATRGPVSEEEGQKIVQLRNEGKSFAEIAKEIGRSLPTVYAKFKAQIKKSATETVDAVELI